MPARFRRLVSRCRRRLAFYRQCLYDANRYLEASTVLGYHPKHRTAQRGSELARHCHSLEKALAMPEFRPRSGAAALRAVIAHLDEDHRIATLPPGQRETAHAVLLAYREKHRALKVDVSDLMRGWKPPAGPVRAEAGGTRPHASGEPPPDPEAFRHLVETRHSVRHFDPARVPEARLLDEAVRLATLSPSVCNRQTWRIHFFTGAEIQPLLALQSGNRGFGHTIPLLAIVASDMRQFTGGEERYQPWIEGGIFSMTFMLALHSLGIGTVPLNWSVTPETDIQLHRLAPIPPHERVAMMIGCGYAAESAQSPISKRTHQLCKS